ncbi:MAG TPA: D-amino-acid transaminase [Draconibacterium sp.]|nr:D-amino-acid transaminase [Draconibacterium sp.]
MSEIVYLNGEYFHREEAKISPDDRGFIFADGIYEVIKYYNGKPFRYDDHLARLVRSLSEIQLKYTSTASLKDIFSELVFQNNLNEKHAGVYLQITRGANGRVHHFPKEIKPTIYAFAFELPSATDKLENGIKVITHEDIRWLRCDIKSVSLMPNTMLYNQAVEAGAGECILLRNGKVTEATHSSVMAVKNGTLITHPLSNLVLPGITRKVVLEICAQNTIPVEERAFSGKELYEMDELFIAGTGSEITPVVEINETSVGNKKPGEITRLIQQKFFVLV